MCPVLLVGPCTYHAESRRDPYTQEIRVAQEFVTEMQACHIVPICADTDENSRNGRTEARVMLCHERASHAALVLQ